MELVTNPPVIGENPQFGVPLRNKVIVTNGAGSCEGSWNLSGPFDFESNSFIG